VPPAKRGRLLLTKKHQNNHRLLVNALATNSQSKGDDDGEAPIKSSKKKKGQLDYNWKDQWYALTYADYVPNPSESAETVPAAVFGNPLVLWRSQDKGILHCADDACPHRRAALTEGRVRDGKLEC
jgi:hypothetical protein